MLENVPALLGETAIGNIDAAQSGVIGDKRPGDGRGPRKKPQPVEQGCLPCTCMRRRGEDNLGHALQEVGSFRASLLLLLQIENDLLDDQAPETVANESDRPALEARLAQENFEDIDGAVLQRHGGPEPIGRRGLVGHGIDRNSFDVLCQPERPEGVVIRCSSPSIVSVAAKAMDENDARSRRPSPAGNFD